MGETCDWCGEYFPNRLILEVDADDPHFVEPYTYICVECAKRNPGVKVTNRMAQLNTGFMVACENAGFNVKGYDEVDTDKTRPKDKKDSTRELQ